MSTDTLKKLRIFVASPSDMASERGKVEAIATTLKPIADYLGLALEVSDWRKVLPDMGRPQQVIFEQLQPTSWDVFIGILWHRFGTPPGGKDPQTQKDYLSGTEEEFRVAHRLLKQFGKPRIVMYRCTRALPYDVDPDQLKRVKEFFKQFEASGEHPGLAQSFDTPEAFEKLLLDHLQKLLIEYGEQAETPITAEVAQVLAPRIPNNLPRRAAFFGRAKEMDVVMRALSPADRTWGVLVDGIGGIGKSALAVEAAYRTQEAGAFDAFVFVTAKQNILAPSGIRELTPAARTLDDLLNETARALGQPGIAKLTGDDPLTGTGKRRALLDALRAMRTLLIYDNLETLSKEEQEALADFLRELPQGSKAIITSRRRGGEGAVWLRVEALDWDAARGIIENEMGRDAGLANKLRRVAEGRWQELYDETSGSPLALVHTLGLMRVRAALTFDGALAMLRGNRDPDLQKFIFQEARKELTANDEAALGALSFFVPSATFETWLPVADLSRNALETTIDRLSALSLVDVLAGEERYTLHPLTRAFVRNELLSDANGARETGARFAQYWVGYARRYGGYSNESYKTHDRLEAEWTSLDATANWLWETARVQGESVGDEDAAQMLNELARALRRFLWFSGRWDECVQLCTCAYEAARAMKDWIQAGWHAHQVAWIHYNCARTTYASRWADRCMEMSLRTGNERYRVFATEICGMVAEQQKDYDKAERLLQEALAMSRNMGNDRDIGILLDNLGGLAEKRKEYEVAELYFHEASELAKKLDIKEGYVACLDRLGSLALQQGRWMEGRKLFEEACLHGRDVGRIDLIAYAQYGLAHVEEAEGHRELALQLAQEALKIFERLQHKDLAEARELVERLTTMMKAEG